MFAVVEVSGGMSAWKESKRKQADIVARQVCE